MAPFLPAENVPECVLETVSRGSRLRGFRNQHAYAFVGQEGLDSPKAQMALYRSTEPFWKPRVELLELLGAPTPDDQSAQTRRE